MKRILARALSVATMACVIAAVPLVSGLAGVQSFPLVGEAQHPTCSIHNEGAAQDRSFGFTRFVR